MAMEGLGEVSKYGVKPPRGEDMQGVHKIAHFEKDSRRMQILVDLIK
jgi:hypothetical protein